MSDISISAGNRFKGKITGSSTIGNIDVRTGNVEVGFEFDGDQEATSEIYADEANKVTNVKQKNISEQKSEIAATNVKQENDDQSTESSTSQTRTPVAVVKPRVAKVEPSQISGIGSTVVSKPKAGNESFTYANMGTVVTAYRIKGNITRSISYVGGVPKNWPTDNYGPINYYDATHSDVKSQLRNTRDPSTYIGTIDKKREHYFSEDTEKHTDDVTFPYKRDARQKPCDPDTVKTTSEMDASDSQVGKFTKALQMYRDGFYEQKKILGEDHPQRFHSKSDIANEFFKRGEFTEELQMYREGSK